MARRSSRSDAQDRANTRHLSGQAAHFGESHRVEAVVAKTVKLPVSLDERLRRHCFDARRTGQDVMLEAIQMYLDHLVESRTR
jgi:hypothetical protein